MDLLKSRLRSVWTTVLLTGAIFVGHAIYGIVVPAAQTDFYWFSLGFIVVCFLGCVSSLTTVQNAIRVYSLKTNVPENKL